MSWNFRQAGWQGRQVGADLAGDKVWCGLHMRLQGCCVEQQVPKISTPRHTSAGGTGADTGVTRLCGLQSVREVRAASRGWMGEWLAMPGRRARRSRPGSRGHRGCQR